MRKQSELITYLFKKNGHLSFDKCLFLCFLLIKNLQKRLFYGLNCLILYHQLGLVIFSRLGIFTGVSLLMPFFSMSSFSSFPHIPFLFCTYQMKAYPKVGFFYLVDALTIPLSLSVNQSLFYFVLVDRLYQNRES